MKTWFKNAFGTRKKHQEQNPNVAIQQMTAHTDSLQKREQLLQKQVLELEAKAKLYLQQGKRNAAAQCVKRRRECQNQITALQTKINNASQLGMKLEEAALDAEHVVVQEQAASALGSMYRGMNVNAVDQVMEDVRNAIDDSREISEILGAQMELDPSIGNQTEDIEHELAALQEELETEQGKFKKQPEKTKKLPTTAASTTSTMEEEPEPAKSAAILM